MRKFIFVFLLLASITGLSAESDIQISSQPFSIWKTSQSKWIGLTNKKSENFVYTGNILKITNHNFLWESSFLRNIGFYESASLIVKDYAAFQISAGPSFKIFQSEESLISASAGFHSIFYTIKRIDLGIESDLRFKFLRKKLFSPLAGLSLGFDFYTSGEASSVIDDKVNSTIYTLTSGQYSDSTGMDQYLCFYIMPYIGFAFNF